VILLLPTFQSNSSFAANSSPSKSPSNFDTFKANINDSLVGFNCEGNNSIGFAGNWNISSKEKNEGLNSLILTSSNSIKSCGRYNSTFDLVYKGVTYTGKSRNLGNNLPDFGNFSTSAIIPTLSLWGTEAPLVGSWVGVVRYAPGFGFIWTESTVRVYNPDTLIFGIDPTVPLVEKNALVFNNKGDFIGIVSKLAIQAVEGLVLVHGAPLQCQFNKSGGSSGLTLCGDGVYAQTIWANTESITNENEEFLNSVKSFIDSSLKQKNTFKGIVSKSKIISKSKKTAYLKIFSKIDSEYKKVDSQIALIRSMSSGEDFRNSTNTLFENWKLWTKDFTKIYNEITSNKI
jgi:hypothetical protein